MVWIFSFRVVYLPRFWEETSKWDLPVLDLFPASGALLGPWRLLGLSFDWHCHDAEKEKKKAHITIFFSPSNVPTDWKPSTPLPFTTWTVENNPQFNKKISVSMPNRGKMHSKLLITLLEPFCYLVSLFNTCPFSHLSEIWAQGLF